VFHLAVQVFQLRQSILQGAWSILARNAQFMKQPSSSLEARMAALVSFAEIIEIAEKIF